VVTNERLKAQPVVRTGEALPVVYANELLPAVKACEARPLQGPVEFDRRRWQAMSNKP